MSKGKALNGIIFDDILTHNKAPVLLVVLIVISAILVISTTNKLYETIHLQRLISKDIKELENNYMHLQLEEDTQSERNKIEAEARTLGLAPLRKDQETILIERK